MLPETLRSSAFGLTAAVLLAVLLLAGCGTQATPQPSSVFGDSVEPAPLPLPTLDSSVVAAGQKIYAENCAACHGANGEGQPDWKVSLPDGTYPAPPHNADGHTWHHGDGTLFQYIKLGGEGMDIPNFKSAMPAFASTLTDKEIVAVITYLKSTWPEEQRRIQLEVSQQDPYPGR